MNIAAQLYLVRVREPEVAVGNGSEKWGKILVLPLPLGWTLGVRRTRDGFSGSVPVGSNLAIFKVLLMGTEDATMPGRRNAGCTNEMMGWV